MSESIFKCQGSDGQVYTVIGRPNYVGISQSTLSGEKNKVRAGFTYRLETGEKVEALGGDDYRIVGTSLSMTIIRTK